MRTAIAGIEETPDLQARSLSWDLGGLVLIVAGVIWTQTSGVLAGGAPDPPSWLAVGAAGAFLAGRIAGGYAPALMGGLAGALVVALFVPNLSEALSGDSAAPPLGYENANAALALQGCLGAVMAALATRAGLARGAAIVLAITCAVLAVAVGSRAVWLMLPAALAIIFAPLSTERALRACMIAFGCVLVGTIGLGLVGASQESASDERRVVLWGEAIDLMLAEPVAGAGPGRYAAVSEIAAGDPDVDWAHHGFLQVGAEQGLVGLGLMVALLAWGFGRLAVAADRGRVRVVAACALAVLATHASIDYVLHFPLLVLTCAGLVGSATARRHLR